MFETLRRFVALLTIVFGAAIAAAQSSVDGAIGGTVEDRSDAVVAGAHIVVRNNGTNAEQTVASDSSGYFRIIHLQPASTPLQSGPPGLAISSPDRSR